MRAAIMGRSIRRGLTGVGSHVANLVRAVATAESTQELTVFLTQDAEPFGIPNLTEVRAPFPTPNEYFRATWEQLYVPIEVRKRRIDLYHSPNYILPELIKVPSIVTIHDLTYLKPDLHKWTSHRYLQFFTARAVRKASTIIAVSEYTKQQIQATYPETEGRVRVIYQGLSAGFGPQSACRIDEFRERRAMDHPYVLFVGTIEPRKNVAALVRAFERAVLDAALPHHLYLVGGRGWGADAVQAALHQSRVRYRCHVLGYVDSEDLPLYYAGADVFVYPSLEEGFGLPPAEAMACGTPVITSNTSSLPEVVGHAAITVDPNDENGLARAIVGVLTDDDLSRRLRAAGPAQAAKFSWDRAAQEHLQVYESALSGGMP